LASKRSAANSRSERAQRSSTTSHQRPDPRPLRLGRQECAATRDARQSSADPRRRSASQDLAAVPRSVGSTSRQHTVGGFERVRIGRGCCREGGPAPVGRALAAVAQG
jgi:hypothetical protein